MTDQTAPLPDAGPASTRPRSRAALLKRLADVVCLPASRINAFERGMTADLLVEMLRDAVPEEREKVARRLATLGDMPGVLVRLLLRDEVMVARALLENSTNLSDADLINCLYHATVEHRRLIALRRGVSDVVADALVDMGATIQIHRECLGGHPCRFGQRNFNHSAVITGPTKLHGADIEVPDLRGGFSHLIAALTAEGTSTVSNVGIISRGYENFITKLELLGADFDLEG